MKNQNKEAVYKLLDVLKEEERDEFLKELLDASFRTIQEGSSKPLVDTLNIWAESAEILLDTAVMDKIQKGKDEYERGETVRWSPK